VTGPDGSAYQFIGEVTVADTDLVDDLEEDELGEVIPTLLNDPPPADMMGLIALPNAVLAGFSKNQLCLSLPNYPHAWPVIYRKTVNTPIVAISNFGTSIVVATQKDLYLGDGSDPQSVTLVKSEIDQGCVSKRSMVSMGHNGVIYASPDGLVQVTPSGVSVITEDYFTRDQWLALVPSSISAYYHNGLYYAFYDTGSVQGGFIFDPSGDSTGVVFISTFATAGFADPLTDELYLQVGSNIQKWDANVAAPITYRWRSKKFDVGDEVNFAFAEVLARSYTSLTFRLLADQGTVTMAQVHSVAVANRLPFPIADYTLSNTHQIELEGTSTVYKVSFAETVAELQRSRQAA